MQTSFTVFTEALTGGLNQADRQTNTDKQIQTNKYALSLVGATRRIFDEPQEQTIYRLYLVRAWQLKFQQLHKFHHYQKCHR